MISFLGVPPPTVIAGLVLVVLLVSVRSLAVKVLLPTVLRVTLSVLVPETNAVMAGRMALLSEELRLTVSEMVSLRFQLASTALTVTLNGVPGDCGAGEAVLPV